MKNILILTTVSGFLAKFERGNIKILQSMGYTIHYAANMEEQHYLFNVDEMCKMGIHMHHIDIARSPYMLQYNIRAICQLKKIIEENNINAIHCHEPVGGALGRFMGICLHKRKIPIIYTAHGFHFYKGAPFINNTLYYFVEKVLARYTDILVVINKEDYENAKKFHLRKDGKVYQIPSVGLDMEQFAPPSPQKRIEKRKKFGIRESDFFLVSVGELNENKNQQIILCALDRMRRAGKDISHIKYGICGDGFFRERIERLVQELDLQDIVTMYGYCNNVPEILSCADASAFPSKREGLGMSGLEALSMGVPLLASNNRGTREYLKDGENGYFCRSNCEDDWINGLEKIQHMSKEKLEEMKKVCRESVKSFRKENSDSVMRLIYQELDTRVKINEKEEKERK